MFTFPITSALTMSLSRSVIGGYKSLKYTPTAADQGASLILNFTRNYYAVQNADEALANTAYPLATLLLDFASDKYFVGGY